MSENSEIRINESIIIEDFLVKDCNATWQYPLEFDTQTGVMSIGNGEKITYHISYTFHSAELMEEFKKSSKNKPLTIFHLSHDKVVVYESAKIKKCNITRKKLEFNCTRKYNITMSQYREIKIAMIGL